MQVVVEVVANARARPPRGTPILVEVRDTSLADAPSVTLAKGEGQVRSARGARLDTVTITLNARAARTTVWALADVDRDGRVSRGDFVTTAAYPVPEGQSPRVQVTVRRV